MFYKILYGLIIFLILNVTGVWPKLMQLARKWAMDVAAKHGHFPPPNMTNADLELCYRLLGISPSSNWDEIEKAYRRKAKVHHPDHGGDEDAMRALNEAYQTLKKMRKP